MSLTKNGCLRCDWCGKLSRNCLGEYTKPDGVSAGYIMQPESERSLNQSTNNDICEECEQRKRAAESLPPTKEPT